MSGWIKFDKDMISDPRLLRAAATLNARYLVAYRSTGGGSDLSNGDASRFFCNALRGALVTLWSYADEHIRDDNTLPCDAEALDAIVGLEGFCDALPDEWLVVSDEGFVKLPDYCDKNNLIAKRKRREAGNARQQRYRQRHANEGDALRDASRRAVDQDLDQDRREDIRRSQTDAPKRNGIDPDLETQILDAYHELLPALPAVKNWNIRRHRKLSDRIRERCAAGKPADTPDYWRSLFSKVAGSDFLCGRRGDWRANLEWLITPKNFDKVIEGHYDNNPGAANGRG